MNNLDELINQLESKLPFFEISNIEISKSNIGWHIEHSLLTVNRITDFLITSNPNDYKPKFNLIKLIILTIKKIPRGRGKSPEIVKPKGKTDKLSLQLHLSETRAIIKQLESLPDDKYFKHPFFGDLKLKQAIKFIEIHSKHHLNIINDIIKKEEGFKTPNN